MTAAISSGSEPAAPGAPASAPRRGYLDWLRGVAVVIMILTHILDSWTRVEDRGSRLYEISVIIGGFGAPLFLFLAGVAVSLSAGSKARRGSEAAAARAVARRGLQIFALAFLFRLQAVVVSWGSWRSLLKVDILNIMGPAIAGSAWLWRAGRTTGGRVAALSAATLALAFLTPVVRSLHVLRALPDPLEGYLRPIPGLTNFVMLPWAGFVGAGAVAGIFIDLARTGTAERRLNLQLAAAGIAMALGAYGASFLPSLYERSDFWTSSPAFFFLRTGILVAGVPLAYAWQQLSAGSERFSPLRQMGRSSLFIYWIHIELIYGLVVRPLHKALTLGQAWTGVIVFCLLMLLLSLLKDRVRARLSSSRRGAQALPSSWADMRKP